MQIARMFATSLAGAMLVGCAGAPPSDSMLDVEFVRGCWVEKDAKDHRINAFLHLLPDGPDEREYAGSLQYVRGIRPGPEIHISIARDTSRASLIRDGERIELPVERTASHVARDGSRRLAFAGVAKGQDARLDLAGKIDRLALNVVSGVSTLGFDGVRDSCD